MAFGPLAVVEFWVGCTVRRRGSQVLGLTTPGPVNVRYVLYWQFRASVSSAHATATSMLSLFFHEVLTFGKPHGYGIPIAICSVTTDRVPAIRQHPSRPWRLSRKTSISKMATSFSLPKGVLSFHHHLQKPDESVQAIDDFMSEEFYEF